jgi:hypothetical protein
MNGRFFFNGLAAHADATEAKGQGYKLAVGIETMNASTGLGGEDLGRTGGKSLIFPYRFGTLRSTPAGEIVLNLAAYNF